jgi:hypothetical protein
MKLHPTKLLDLVVKVPNTSNYNYNSRGFRDQEWPTDLTSALWCVGGKFTAGIGIDEQDTWTTLLGQCLGRRIINVSSEHADNNWIEDCTCNILKEVKPAHIIVQWSYFNAYPNSCLTDFAGHCQDMTQRIMRVEGYKSVTQVTHNFTPDAVFPGPDRKLYRDWVSSLPTTIDTMGPLITLDVIGDDHYPGPLTHQAAATIFQRRFTNSRLIDNNWM